MSKGNRKASAKKSAPPAAALPSAWWLLLAVAAVAFAAYIHTLNFQFVHDDDRQVLRNPWIRDWSHLGEIFTTDVWRFREPSHSSNYYRPIHMLLHTLGYSISGLTSWGYHLINVVLHSLCSALTALLAFKLLPRVWLAAAAGMLYAVHPVHAESVTWIAGVTDLACAAFYLGALCLYVDGGERPERMRRRMFLVALLFLGALLSKEMAFTFPLAAALLDWSLHRKLRWSNYAWMAGVFAAYLALRIWALGAFHVTQNPVRLGWLDQALSLMVIFGEYLIKLAVPYDLNAFHVFTPATMLPVSRIAIPLATLAAFLFAAWRFRRERAVLFATGFSLLSILPVLNISGIGENVFADRYLYIPTAGGCILLGLLAGRAWLSLPERFRRTGMRVGVGVFAAVAVSYCYILAQTTFMWRDPITLYTETLKRSPEASLMANSLGAEYFYRGRYDEARYWFERASRIRRPDFVRRDDANLFDSYSGLAGVYLHEGDMQKALEFFGKAEKILPNEVSLLQNLGVVHATMGDYETALSYYRRALAVNPQSEYTYNNFAAVYVKTGRYDEALQQVERALAISPAFGDAYLTAGRAYAGKGQWEEARRAYQRAVTLDPAKKSVVNSELQSLPATPAVRP